MSSQLNTNTLSYQRSKQENLLKTLNKQKVLIAMILPAVIITILFRYLPMYGIIISFQKYFPAVGVLKSEWVGFDNFIRFFGDQNFKRVMINTFLLGIYDIIFVFPAPIIFALLLNEVQGKVFKRVTQTITYFPHFISTVIVVGMLIELFSIRGPVNILIEGFGYDAVNFFGKPEWFRFLYIISHMWSTLGWGSILYLAAIAGINPEIYESAVIDGANRFQKIIYITIPSIMSTISLMLILRVGSILGTDYQKILLMYNPSTYDTADVLSTYTYRVGLEGAQYSYASAIGLFMSIIALFFLMLSNYVAKKNDGNSLW